MELFIIKSGEEYEPSTTHGIISSEAGANEALMWIEALDINKAYDLAARCKELDGTPSEYAYEYNEYTSYWITKYTLDEF